MKKLIILVGTYFVLSINLFAAIPEDKEQDIVWHQEEKEQDIEWHGDIPEQSILEKKEFAITARTAPTPYPGIDQTPADLALAIKEFNEMLDNFIDSLVMQDVRGREFNYFKEILVKIAAPVDQYWPQITVDFSQFLSHRFVNVGPLCQRYVIMSLCLAVLQAYQDKIAQEAEKLDERCNNYIYSNYDEKDAALMAVLGDWKTLQKKIGAFKVPVVITFCRQIVDPSNDSPSDSIAYVNRNFINTGQLLYDNANRSVISELYKVKPVEFLKHKYNKKFRVQGFLGEPGREVGGLVRNFLSTILQSFFSEQFFLVSKTPYMPLSVDEIIDNVLTRKINDKFKNQERDIVRDLGRAQRAVAGADENDEKGLVEKQQRLKAISDAQIDLINKKSFVKLLLVQPEKESEKMQELKEEEKSAQDQARSARENNLSSHIVKTRENNVERAKRKVTCFEQAKAEVVRINIDIKSITHAAQNTCQSAFNVLGRILVIAMLNVQPVIVPVPEAFYAQVVNPIPVSSEYLWRWMGLLHNYNPQEFNSVYAILQQGTKPDDIIAYIRDVVGDENLATKIEERRSNWQKAFIEYVIKEKLQINSNLDHIREGFMTGAHLVPLHHVADAKTKFVSLYKYLNGEGNQRAFDFVQFDLAFSKKDLAPDAAIAQEFFHWLKPIDMITTFFRTKIDAEILKTKIQFVKIDLEDEGIQIADIYENTLKEYLTEKGREDDQGALSNFVAAFTGARAYDGRTLIIKFVRTRNSDFIHECFNTIEVGMRESALVQNYRRDASADKSNFIRTLKEVVFPSLGSGAFTGS